MACVALAATSLPTYAVAQTPPDYGLDFVTVGDAGNRGTLPSERPLAIDGDIPYGAVNYEYRITRTEISAGDWVEFCNAYRPYWTGSTASTSFTGTNVRVLSDDMTFATNAPNGFNNPSWEMAARYCNWLCNDKRPEQWAFETGAYDTSTFTFNEDFSGNHQAAHTPGARYWIPTLDEMIKAFYYDPDRYGDGEGGYWRYPNSSNEPLITGEPPPFGNGTTNAGLVRLGTTHPIRIGDYPDVQTPWGLLDASGGFGEMTETTTGFLHSRYSIGSSIFTPADVVSSYDRLDDTIRIDTVLSTGGFRIASIVPTPNTVAVLGLLFFTPLTRRPRRAPHE